MELWDHAQQILDKVDLSKAGLIVWSIWNVRNQAIQRNLKIRPSQFIIDIKQKMANFDYKRNSHLAVGSTENHPSQSSWKPPEINRWKLNSDAAWFDASNSGGLGWSIHDSDGSRIGAGCNSINKNDQIKVLKAMAIKKRGWKPLPVKSMPAIVGSRSRSKWNPIQLRS